MRTTKPCLSRDEQRAHHHTMKYDVEPPVLSGARGYWSGTERRKRARRRARSAGLRGKRK